MGDNKGFLGMQSHLIASDTGSCQNKLSPAGNMWPMYLRLLTII